MYQKEDFKITLPEKTYLENSAIIKNLGLKCTDLNDDFTDYWINGENSDSNSASIVNAYGQIGSKSSDCSSGVRPVIKSKNLKEIVQSAQTKNEDNIKIIDFGQWYSPNTVQLENPTDLKFTNRSYPIGEKNMGLEFESNKGRYVLFGDKFHPVIPIKWYYDEEEDLLLSKHSLFYSLRSPKLYNSNNITFSLFDILNNQVLPIILDSENSKKRDKSLSQELSELLEKQERLNKMQAQLNEQIHTLTLKTKTYIQK